ncbi:unnamed protein product [Boreogadus saida]
MIRVRNGSDRKGVSSRFRYPNGGVPRTRPERCPDSPLLPVWSFKCPSAHLVPSLIVPFCPSGPSSALPVPF